MRQLPLNHQSLQQSIALVDCNSFYASCERIFNPKLLGKPIVVLSNNDGCIITRSSEAKALGIKMGEPYFKAKKIIEENNVLLITFNDHGIVTKYEVIDKNKMKKVKFVKDETPTITSNQDFIYSFLSSLRRKINDPSRKKLKKK